jgi:hypothetical protein
VATGHPFSFFMFAETICMIKIYIIIGFLLTPVDFLAQHIVKPQQWRGAATLGNAKSSWGEVVFLITDATIVLLLQNNYGNYYSVAGIYCWRTTWKVMCPRTWTSLTRKRGLSAQMLCYLSAQIPIQINITVRSD